MQKYEASPQTTAKGKYILLKDKKALKHNHVLVFIYVEEMV